MENMGKGLTVPKWVLINWPKIPKMYLPKLSAQARKFGISMKKGLHWASVVRESGKKCTYICYLILHTMFFSISQELLDPFLITF